MQYQSTRDTKRLAAVAEAFFGSFQNSLKHFIPFRRVFFFFFFLYKPCSDKATKILYKVIIIISDEASLNNAT